jgi:hypothetical protein
MVKNRQDEGGSLPASGHRAGDDVAAVECGGYCFSLNWGWSLESQLFETFMEAGVKL